MKIFLKGLFTAFAFTLLFAACDDDNSVELIDSSQPDGAFTPLLSGSFTAENGTPTAGTAEVGTDSKGTYFLRFGSNFTTKLGTGTVTIFLSTSATYMADPGNGNPNIELVGIVSKNGEQYVKLDGAPASKFSHIIIWCASANIPFGHAPLN